MKIVALYTCFNRKLQTLSSLSALYDSLRIYNQQAKNGIIELSVVLTDDGCTDGTADAIRQQFPVKDIIILQGTGSLFWAGGMRLAWNEALKRHEEWDYYLLVNDDTDLFTTCFIELMNTEAYCRQNYHKEGLVSGITCAKDDVTRITYGGDIIPNKFNGRQIRLGRSSNPQMVDLTNANILLVPKQVVDTIGIFYDGYKHGRADNDYSMQARKHHIPVLITAGACGACDNDHGSITDFRDKVLSMNLSERKEYFRHPLHCDSDYLTFVRRNMPLRYPMSWIFRKMMTYCPKIYFTINGARKVK